MRPAALRQVTYERQEGPQQRRYNTLRIHSWRLPRSAATGGPRRCRGARSPGRRTRRWWRRRAHARGACERRQRDTIPPWMISNLITTNSTPPIRIRASWSYEKSTAVAGGDGGSPASNLPALPTSYLLRPPEHHAGQLHPDRTKCRWKSVGSFDWNSAGKAIFPWVRGWRNTAGFQTRRRVFVLGVTKTPLTYKRAQTAREPLANKRPKRDTNAFTNRSWTFQLTQFPSPCT